MLQVWWPRALPASVALAPGPFPFCLPWVTLSQAEVKLPAQPPGLGCMAGPLERGHCQWLIKCLFVYAGAASAWEYRTRVEASAPGAALSPGKHPPAGEASPAPARAPLRCLCWLCRISLGDKGIKSSFSCQPPAPSAAAWKRLPLP